MEIRDRDRKTVGNEPPSRNVNLEGRSATTKTKQSKMTEETERPGEKTPCRAKRNSERPNDDSDYDVMLISLTKEIFIKILNGEIYYLIKV